MVDGNRRASPVWKGFTKAQLVRAYRRRRDWLRARTMVREDSGKAISLDVQELAMLEWLASIAGIDDRQDTELVVPE